MVIYLVACILLPPVLLNSLIVGNMHLTCPAQLLYYYITTSFLHLVGSSAIAIVASRPSSYTSALLNNAIALVLYISLYRSLSFMHLSLSHW